MPKKYFRVALEGDIADQRDIVIKREWIEQMASSYSPELFGARVNLEHIRGIDPDGLFKCYGDVTALKAEEVTIGDEKLLALYAEIDPTEELIALSKKRQKVYTSIELEPNFKKTSGAYLVGLAITDTPAALGTEMLKFCAQTKQIANPLLSRKNSSESLIAQSHKIELSFPFESNEQISLSERVSSVLSQFSLSKSKDDEDIKKSVELLANTMKEMAGQIPLDQSAKIEELSTQLSNVENQLKTLKEELDAGEQFESRPPAAGGDGEEKVNY